MADRAKALLLAGGLGTRLRPITETVPKCLVPVGGRPMLDYWLDALEAAGIGEALLNTHHLRDQVRAWMDAANATRPVRVSEAWEPELLGSAGTVHANRGWADDADEIVIIYADNLSTVDLEALLAFHRGHDDPMTMLLFRTAYPKQCGIATLDAAGRVTAFVEKPEHPESDLANAGLYVVSAEAWREIADMDVFDFGFDVIPRFVGRMRGMPFDGYHRDIGNHEALAAANADAPRLFGAAT
jgi:mannose-1-phosphate guanylyltransferase